LETASTSRRFITTPFDFEIEPEVGESPRFSRTDDAHTAGFFALDGIQSYARLFGGPTAPLLRPTTLFAQDAGDVTDIDPNDIIQEGLGDCYLMSSLAALARVNPEAIRNMIHENRDASGKVVSYTVDLWDKESHLFGLYHSNEKRSITVDASFPMDHAASADVGGDGSLEIWPLIIEKAYAQMKGGYDKIGNGGWPADAMFALTGRDAHSYTPWETQPHFFQGNRGYPDRTEPAAITWESAKADLAAGKLETLCTQNRDDLPYGLKGNHCYAISGFHVDPLTGKKMVDLQNPWGDKHASVPWDEFQKFGTKFTISG
jgi:hypothetical protein